MLLLFQHWRSKHLSPRNLKKAQYEQSIFRAFLDAYPSIAARVRTVSQPDDDFPDVVTMQMDGLSVQWELGEWLQPDQTAIAKKRERLKADIEETLGDQGINFTEHILFCLLSLQQQVSRFDKRDGDTLCTEIMRLIQDVDTRWSHSQFWWSLQGYLCRTFDGYPTLQKYMATIHFEPRVRQGEKQYWADYIPWICLEEQGGAYTPQVALDELINRLKRKNEHYGTFGESDIRLVIHYNHAVLYNTPFIGIMGSNVYRTFEDVAILAAKCLEEIVIPFKRVYLLNAPGREVFEIYPKLGRC